MTLYHFGNCIALIYVPYYLTYKYSGLSEYGAFWKCIQAGLIYMITQLAKMLILATFFPDNDADLGSDVLSEFLKTTVDIIDLGGLYIVLNRIPGKGHSKVLTAGIGWATAEVILSRALLLWFGARGAEFDWKYIQKCLESNISLLHHIATVTLVWLWSRHDLKNNLKPIVTALLVFSAYKNLILDFVFDILLTGPWIGLVIKAIVTLMLGGFTLTIYAGLAQSIGIF
ncbi:small seven transmembrane domain-containing protein [Holotrichia oblita]|uniref:Small seven transmembrane domain-containing protein n=2 Tax=Holotrichia oblita TaxID=644536 RepID=A0ACB9T7G3_HOLOL|nr:small seven transmembrane domain-containing protein [Holotrichia oblita]KAI4462756.1 small seven transmembrane domain-containing protein [Holotrichia oblita]